MWVEVRNELVSTSLGSGERNMCEVKVVMDMGKT